MKFIKTIKYLFFLGLLNFANLIPGFSQGDFCNQNYLPTGTVCGKPETLRVQVFVSNPNNLYPPCSIMVEYKKRTCYFESNNRDCPLILFFQYQLLSLDWDWEACPELTRFIFPGYPNDYGPTDWEHWRIFAQDVQRAIGVRDFIEFYNSLPEDRKAGFQCIGPDCNFGECVPLRIDFTNPKCRAICEVKRGTNLKRTFIPCLPFLENCCRHEIKVCWCSATQSFKVEENTYSMGVGCENTEPSGPPCVEQGSVTGGGDYTVFRSCYAGCQ